ncbi:MAG TPA: hypothetical protein VF101_06680 [Gaiellaceae bacterium]
MSAGRSLSPLFKLALCTLLLTTVATFAAAVAYSIYIPNPTKSQSDAEAKLFQAASYSLTALVGLFTGRVA